MSDPTVDDPRIESARILAEALSDLIHERQWLIKWVGEIEQRDWRISFGDHRAINFDGVRELRGEIQSEITGLLRRKIDSHERRIFELHPAPVDDPEPAPESEDYLASRLKGLREGDLIELCVSGGFVFTQRFKSTGDDLVFTHGSVAGSTIEFRLSGITSVTIHAPNEGREAFWERVCKHFFEGDSIAFSYSDMPPETCIFVDVTTAVTSGRKLVRLREDGMSRAVFLHGVSSITITRPEAHGGDS